MPKDRASVKRKAEGPDQPILLVLATGPGEKSYDVIELPFGGTDVLQALDSVRQHVIDDPRPAIEALASGLLGPAVLTKRRILQRLVSLVVVGVWGEELLKHDQRLSPMDVASVFSDLFVMAQRIAATLLQELGHPQFDFARAAAKTVSDMINREAYPRHSQRFDCQLRSLPKKRSLIFGRDDPARYTPPETVDKTAVFIFPEEANERDEGARPVAVRISSGVAPMLEALHVTHGTHLEALERSFRLVQYDDSLDLAKVTHATANYHAIRLARATLDKDAASAQNSRRWLVLAGCSIGGSVFASKIARACKSPAIYSHIRANTDKEHVVSVFRNHPDWFCEDPDAAEACLQ